MFFSLFFRWFVAIRLWLSDSINVRVNIYIHFHVKSICMAYFMHSAIINFTLAYQLDPRTRAYISFRVHIFICAFLSLSRSRSLRVSYANAIAHFQLAPDPGNECECMLPSGYFLALFIIAVTIFLSLLDSVVRLLLTFCAQNSFLVNKESAE